MKKWKNNNEKIKNKINHEKTMKTLNKKQWQNWKTIKKHGNIKT